MNSENIRQLKLSSGEEIVCEVLEEYEEEVVARLVLRIAKYELSLNQTYYTFKPWMAYQDNVNESIMLSKYHILGMADPVPELLEQYESYYELSLEEGRDSDQTSDALSQLKERNPHLSNSDFSNVINFSFPGRTKIH